MFNPIIEEINSLSDTCLPTVPPIWTTQWLQDVLFWRYTLDSIAKQEGIRIKDELIKQRIEFRAHSLLDNQKRMIASILDKPKRSIIVDRLATSHNGNDQLYTDAADVLHYAPLQYTALQKKRQHLFSHMNKRWMDIYSPMAHIKDHIYDHIMDMPTEQEWEEALRN